MKLALNLLLAISLSLFAQLGKTEETSTRVWINYIETVQAMITEQWRPKGFLESYYTVVNFELNQDGSLKKINLEKKSGNKEFDSYAVNTVKLAAPFAAMPSSDKPIKVKYYFDYKYATEDFILDSGAIKN